MSLTPEQAVKHTADKLSRRFFWATLAILAVAWMVFAAAVLFTSWTLAGLGALILLPAAGCALASFAFHDPRLRQRAAEQVRQAKSS
jgi:hypothetical protein